MIDGVKGTDPVEQWISGTDGTYTEEDAENGTIPLGFEVGDLRLHQIRYLPAGEYVLVEEKTPFGFLRAKDICFTVLDEGKVQGVEMVDELPEGILEIVKHDIDHPGAAACRSRLYPDEQRYRGTSSDIDNRGRWKSSFRSGSRRISGCGRALRAVYLCGTGDFCTGGLYAKQREL